MEDNYSDEDAEDGLEDDHEYSRRAWTEPVVHLSTEFSSRLDAEPHLPQEDQTIMELVSKLGNRRWVQIASMLEGRTGKQCRERSVRASRPLVTLAPPKRSDA